jgi:hypothetical protein
MGRGFKEKGQAIIIELPEIAIISEVIVDSGGLTNFYSHYYTIEFSKDGNNWLKVIENSTATDVDHNHTLGHQAKFIRITNQQDSNSQPWRVNELSLFGSYL